MLVCAVPKVVGYKLDMSPVMNYLGLLCGRVASACRCALVLRGPGKQEYVCIFLSPQHYLDI